MPDTSVARDGGNPYDPVMEHRVSRLEEDVRDTLDRAVKALEPLAIAIIGFLVGGILVAAFLPIYAVVSKL